jgi:hypothetical protein
MAKVYSLYVASALLNHPMKCVIVVSEVNKELGTFQERDNAGGMKRQGLYHFLTTALQQISYRLQLWREEHCV